MARRREIEIEVAVGRSFLFILLVAVVLVVSVGTSQANPLPAPPAAPLLWPVVPGSFYLTVAKYYGDEPLTACAPGYHMASLWEIADPSNLRYDTTLGVTSADSGSGPPTGPPQEYVGWVRTGYHSPDVSAYPGLANCNAWTSSNGVHNGTAVGLPYNWQTSVGDVGPWTAGITSCGGTQWRVWCVRPVQVIFLPSVLRNY
jgi:hypothetical protein